MNYQNPIEIKKSLAFKTIFFLFSFIEIYSEFANNILLQWWTKPFLMPALIGLYFITSKNVSYLYVIALLFNWFANLLFISTEIKLVLLASVSFLIYRFVIIVTIFKDKDKVGIIPIVLGSIPFLFLFLSLISVICENITSNQMYLIIAQSILMSLFGGFSLGNYIIRNTISSKFLMISSLFFGINLFILGVKFYFIDLAFLKPISMIFFVLGQYTFYHFMILKEKT